MGVLRLFLALSVMVFHMPEANFSLVHAGVAVILFFIISGFYMGLVVNEVYRDNTISFYKARLLRIFPTYWAAAAIMVGWFAYTNSPNVISSNIGMPFLSHLSLAAMNVFVLGQGLFESVYDSLQNQQPNPISDLIVPLFPTGFFETKWMLIGQAWSLSPELLFYFMAPFVVRSVPRILLLLGISLAIRFAMLAVPGGFASEVWGYRFFPPILCFFLLGSLAYHVYERLKVHRHAARIGNLVIAAMLLTFVASGVLQPVMFGTSRETGYDTVAAWVGYIAFAMAIPFVFARCKDSRIDRMIGDLSYPLYLIHGLVIGIVFQVLGGQPGTNTSEAAAIAAALFAAAGLHFLVERPVDGWRYRRVEIPVASGRKRRIRWAIAAAIAAVLLVGDTFLATTFGRTYKDVPILVTVEGRYNIVRFDGRYFAVPHGVAVDWESDDLENVEGMRIGTSEEELVGILRASQP